MRPRKTFAFFAPTLHAEELMQPLALVFYERLMPGSQLVNRLQDLNYRVLPLSDAARLAATVQRESPLLLFIDLAAPGDVCGVIAALRTAPATAHLPVIGFAPETAPELLTAARAAGANITVTETAVINHLSQLIDQALHVD
jgi:CheY-like chemotaxis protein